MFNIQDTQADNTIIKNISLLQKGQYFKMLVTNTETT
jgi:hypothetical protein